MAATRNSRSSNLLARAGAWLAARLGPSDALSVGLSGGCDSVVLLHVLCALGLTGRLQAIHVHHGLSPNADAWAAFCADYCHRLGVPLVLRRVVVENDSRCGLEAAARAARYRVFADVAGDVLLLAHHRGDQAETVLFNLLRGAGVTGAAGMPAERRFGERRLLRPLLGVARGEIETYARQAGLAWIEDESNRDTGLTRNYLRHEALVALAQRFPAAEAALAQAAGHFAEAGALLDELAVLDWQRVSDGDAAALSALRQLSLPRLKNLLRYRLRTLGWQVPVARRLEAFAHQLLTAAPDRHPELQLPDGRMVVARRALHWCPGK
ncbi:MAG: tRNA lysidine(34) synthetase TilS [Azonexus sp.]